jgi:antibiotic biosynthesis monooxygenase (ABM) superfamily enzyme
MRKPKKWKMAILVWLVIYPTITTITLLLGSYLIQLPVFVRTFVMSVILVPFMIFVALPQITKFFHNWLSK